MTKEPITQYDLLKKDIEFIKQQNDDLKVILVTQQEFHPVKIIVYGMVGIVLTSVLAAIITSVIIKSAT